MDWYIDMEKQQNKNQTKRISPNQTAIIGAILTLIGGFFLFYNYIEKKTTFAFDYMASILDEQSSKENIILQQDGKKTEKEEQEQDSGEEITNEYIGYLIIPKINLTKGFLDKRSPENDVEKNILVVEGSTYPDKEKGNLILAGHSGTGWKAFFNELYQLTIGDYAYVTYKNKKYIYQIKNIYKQQKTGKIAIYRNYDKTTLTLVTCTNYDQTTQTIYIAELEKIEE